MHLMNFPNICCNDIRSKSPSCFFGASNLSQKASVAGKIRSFSNKILFQSLAGCDAHEKRLDSLRTITNEQDCMIYLSSFIHLLRIIYSSYWIWRVVWGMSREAGFFAPQLSMGGAGCGALEQSPRYWEGSMKVQIRKYGGGNYDGIGCGAQVS